MSVLVWAAVVLIGGAGSVLRFLVDGLVSSAADRDFPFGTLVVNISRRGDPRPADRARPEP